MKNDYATNSHYLTYTFLFKKVGRILIYFLSLVVKGLKQTHVHFPACSSNLQGEHSQKYEAYEFPHDLLYTSARDV